MLVDIANRQSLSNKVVVCIVNNFYNAELVSTFDPRVKVVRFERNPGSRGIWWLVRLYALFARMRPDVIHVHNQDMLKIISRHFTKSVFFTAHGLLVPVENLHKGITTVAISQAVADDLKRRNAGSRVVTIPNGVDVDAIRFKTAERNDGKRRLVQVGRLNMKVKGQDLLLESLAMLHRAGRREFEVHFIGDGPDREMLEAMATKLGLGESVLFHGGMSRKDLYDSLCDYDIMVHPARTEGFGLVIAEGLAAGLRVVVSDIAGPVEVVDGGRRGCIVEKENPEALMRGILLADGMDVDAQGGREAMKELYSIDMQVENYRKAYQDSIKSASFHNKTAR